MNENTVLKCRLGTAEYVVAHEVWRRSIGMNPSASYLGETNPLLALNLARWVLSLVILP